MIDLLDMSFIRNFLAGPQTGQAPSGADTVDKLCDRVQSSTLVEDRRDAVRALKSLSKKFRLEVGTKAMDILIHVLETDRADSEILGFALEALCNIMSNEVFGDDQEVQQNLPEDLGLQFTEMFIKNPENISLLLSLLQEYDFLVLWPSVRLLTLLLINKTKEIQEIILTKPMGISRLMDLLVDSREIIRNDDLLLLQQLTRNNTNIQKIVAFENAFERLFDIIRDEGNSDGGVVVEDCLHLLLNLLKNNLSNQNFLKEGSYIQRLPVYFDLNSSDKASSEGWSAQKVSNVHLMLELVRTLVSPNNPQQQTSNCQKVMNQFGLLEKLCAILMASGVPADVLTETINCVSELIRGNQCNQEYFASVLAPSNPPRPAIVVLLMSMVNEKQPFVLRCAVLYCFQSFLYKNELGQSQIIQTLLPSTTEVNQVTAGQLLCSGLFSQDSMSTWFAAVALSHSIIDNPAQKEQLLRVQLATSLGNPPISLIQQCTNILSQGAKLQTRVGLLQLLCNWLVFCPIAVTHFLHNSANVPYLISQVSASEGDELELIVQGLCAFLLGICILYNNNQVQNYQKNDLRQIIEKRIGMEQYTDRLSQIAKHEGYSRAAKKPQLAYRQPSEVIFDYEFTRLIKKLENDVLKAVSPIQDLENEKKPATLEQHDSIVEQYKKLIRDQDIQLNSVRRELTELQSKSFDWHRQLDEATQQIQQLQDQNALLKAQRTSGTNPFNSAVAGDPSELSRLRLELEDKEREISECNRQIDALKSDLSRVNARNAGDSVTNGSTLIFDGSGQRNTVADLELQLMQKEEELRLYKSKLDESVEQKSQLCSTNEDPANVALLPDQNNLTVQIADLQTKNSRLTFEKADVEKCMRELLDQNSLLQKKVEALELEKTDLELDKHQENDDMESLKKEQDELLILLADQDTKIKSYRNRLKELGEKLEEDEEDDDDKDVALEDDMIDDESGNPV